MFNSTFFLNLPKLKVMDGLPFQNGKIDIEVLFVKENEIRYHSAAMTMVID